MRNIYFDATPLSLIGAVVTEEGQLDGSGIAAAVAARRRQYADAFQLPS